MKCKNCGRDTWQERQTHGWSWVRCRRCGFHTSSYTCIELAVAAKDAGEHYVSSDGNDIVEWGPL